MALDEKISQTLEYTNKMRVGREQQLVNRGKLIESYPTQDYVYPSKDCQALTHRSESLRLVPGQVIFNSRTLRGTSRIMRTLRSFKYNDMKAA